MKEKQVAERVMIGKPERRIPPGRARLEDTIKINLEEIGLEMSTGLIRLRMRTDGGLLWRR
jgi:hypothetical protein